MTALRFVLSIGHDDDGAIRIAATGPAGTVDLATPIPVPAVPSEGSTVRDWDEARRIGSGLFAFAFPRAVDELLEESRHRASETPLTIALDVADERLAALPWELLFDPDVDRFLALSTGTPLTRSGEDVAEESPPEYGNLRVRVVAPVIDESVLASSEALAPDPRVDVSAGTPAAPPRRRPHVVILRDGLDSATVIRAKTPMAIVDGTVAEGRRALSHARAVLVLPPDLTGDNRAVFLRTLLGRLALGDPVEAATVAARRALATDRSAPPGEWAGPVLLTRTLPAPVVEPQEISTILGRHVMEHTVSWVQDALAGIVSSVVVFLVGIVLFRLGFSSSSSFQLDILSPVSLYQSFSALMIELSNYRQWFLLVASGVMAAATAAVAFLWWRNRVIDPEEATGIAARFAGPLSRLRTLTFLAVATLTVLGSYAYQQYLWQVKLPIPAGALGIAVTQDSQTGAFQQQLSATLADPTSAQAVVVRELPVQYDAGDLASARQVGKRIGAEAVIVYRSNEHDGQTDYTGYLVFTDAHLGRTFISRPPTVLTGAHPAPAVANTRIQEGIAVPILRATSLDALAEAGAGIVDYQAGRIDQAIPHLERARQAGIAEADAGVLDFYLASAYALDERMAAAQTTYASAAAAFEKRATTERLGPQDELVLVTAYLDLGNLARESGDWTTAIDWLLKGIAHRDQLLAQASGLDNPTDVNDVYSRIYAALAAAYQATGDQEEERFWAQRTQDELQTLEEHAPRDRSGLVRLAATQLAAGDCVGAVDSVNQALTLAPGDADALLNAAAIAYRQADQAMARQKLEGVPPDDAIGVRAHDELGLLSMIDAVNPSVGYVEPSLLATAGATFEAVASPSGLAVQETGAAASWMGATTLQDVTGLYGGDELTAAKSRVEWAADPVRRRSAIDAYSEAIDRLTALAMRRPNDPTVSAALASAYAGRMGAYAAGVTGGGQDGALVAADAAAVRSLATKVLATDSGASRRDRLAAWALALEAMNDLQLSGGDAQGAASPDAVQQALDQATSEARSAPPTDDAEAAAIRAIYDEVYRHATAIAPDPSQAAAAASARAAVVGPSANDQALLRTVCGEELNRLEGDALLAAGDAAGAQSHYESALKTNQLYAPALIGLSAARERQGDGAGAVAQATAATQAATDLAAAWRRLAVAQLTAGDAAARDAAMAHFFGLVAGEPSQVGTADLRQAIAELADLLKRRPDLASPVRDVIPQFRSVLDAAPDDGGYQLAARYAELGNLALMADDPATAESLLRRSLDLDAHQPLALTDLALAVLVQGHDATSEIRAAVDEAQAPIWASAGIGEAEILARMSARLADYASRFPDRAPAIAPLTEAIAEAEAAATLPEGGTPAAEASPAPQGTPAPGTPPAATPTALSSYQSQQFGFSVTTTGDWSIVKTFPQQGADGVQLVNGVSILNVIVLQVPGVTPAQCLQTERNAIATAADVSNLKLMTGPDGKAIRGNSPDRAFAAFRYTYGKNDGMTPDRVKYISCQTYPAPNALLLVEQFAPTDRYEEQAAAREELLATLVLPKK
jgi:hypothetical protein